MPKKLLLAFSFICFLCLSCEGYAQDQNYWTNQFGSRSGLLSGLVVGGVRDTSAGYYNPGALGFIDNESLTVSASALRYERTNINDGAGDNEDLESDRLNFAPVLISGVIFPDDCNCHVIGYSLLTRHYTSFKTSARRETFADVVHNSSFPGAEDYIGQLNFSSNLREYWGGLSYAHAFDQHISLGFTNFLALRDQSSTFDISARAINPDITAVSDDSSDYDFFNGRLLWKAGAALDYDELKFGLTITTPSISLFGNGNTARDITIANMDIDGDGDLDSFVADDRQDDLDAEIQTPLSVAVGVEWRMLPETTVSAGLEWFSKVRGYNVLDPESGDFVRPVGTAPEFDSKDFLEITDAADPVVNFGAGVEQRLTDSITGVLSFRTDYSYSNPGESQSQTLGISDWDIFHIVLGGTYKRTSSDLSIGLFYSFGRNGDLQQVANFEDPQESNLLKGDTRETSVDYTAVGALLGYTYYFR